MGYHQAVERALWELLNPANMSSEEETEFEDLGENSLRSLASVNKLVKKLLNCKVLGVDEIRPEMLKALDIVGLAWLACLFNATWMSETVPV